MGNQTSKVLAADVRRLREETGCGMHDAARGLELRNGDYELAKEWVLRHNLAAVMSDKARFPLYHASRTQTATERKWERREPDCKADPCPGYVLLEKICDQRTRHMQEAQREVEALKAPTVERGTGCPACSGTGYAAFAEAPAATQDSRSSTKSSGDVGLQTLAGEVERPREGTAAGSTPAGNITEDVELAASLLAQEGYVLAAMRLKAAWKARPDTEEALESQAQEIDRLYKRVRELYEENRALKGAKNG